MADATVWASIVSLLSVFDFKKGRDAEGKEIDITPMFSDGGVRQATRICMAKSCCLTLHFSVIRFLLTVPSQFAQRQPESL